MHSYLIIAFVKMGQIFKRYEKVEFQVVAKSHSDAQLQGCILMRKQYSDKVWFIARVYEAGSELV